MIMLMDAVGLTEHDQYVCHDYRDPFRYRVPGYRETEIRDGQIYTPVKGPDSQPSSQPASRPISPITFSPPSVTSLKRFDSPIDDSPTNQDIVSPKVEFETSPNITLSPKITNNKSHGITKSPHDLLDDYSPPSSPSKIAVHMNPSVIDKRSLTDLNSDGTPKSISPIHTKADVFFGQPPADEFAVSFVDSIDPAQKASTDQETDKLNEALDEIAALRAQLKNQEVDRELNVKADVSIEPAEEPQVWLSDIELRGEWSVERVWL